jgi:hypothetical protein
LNSVFYSDPQFNTPARAALFDQVPQALGQGANDNDAQLVGAVLWAVLRPKKSTWFLCLEPLNSHRQFHLC